jgi:hypothetical protein
VNAVSAIALDGLFILLIAGLYAVTHWLVWVLSRLGGIE